LFVQFKPAPVVVLLKGRRPSLGLDFVAVDFEIANYDLSSACAVGLAVVRDGQLTAATSYLIRPPTRRFVFTRIHRLKWKDVCDAPTFSDLWNELRDQLGSEILVAHNAVFDRMVLCECLRHYRIPYRLNPFLCSMELCKELFGFSRLKLDYVCRQLEIALEHHNAESDANAAASIVIKAADRLSAASTSELFEFLRAKPFTARPNGHAGT
jgi:DNA polymerase-3 subunit epsilon